MLKVRRLYKSFNAFHVLKDISFEMRAGETLAVIGPSGTGKSTLLRCINFLVHPDSGTVEIDGFKVDSTLAGQKDIYALRRKTSMVFPLVSMSIVILQAPEEKGNFSSSLF